MPEDLAKRTTHNGFVMDNEVDACGVCGLPAVVANATMDGYWPDYPALTCAACGRKEETMPPIE